ncbi:MAG: EamA family transporter [Desulfitobacteriaceae bacterium]
MLVALTILNSLLMVSGQILWKMGVSNKEINSLTELLGLFLNPFILTGIGIYVCASGLWIYILNKGELSFVYPIQSTAFIFAVIAGSLLFKENLTLSKIVGTVVIILGIIILTRK